MLINAEKRKPKESKTRRNIYVNFGFYHFLQFIATYQEEEENKKTRNKIGIPV